MSERKPSAHESMRSAVKETAQSKSRELASLLKRGEVSVHELEAIQYALEGLRQAAATPEGLATFCQEQVLGVDADALREQGFDLNGPESTRAQSKAAKKVQKEVRALLDKILHRDGALTEARQDAVVRAEYASRGIPGAEKILSVNDDAVRKIEALKLPPDIKAGFLGRALEARRQALRAAAEIESPEIRLQKSMDELADQLATLCEAILLSAKSTSEHPVLSEPTVDNLAHLSNSAMANLLDNPSFQLIEAAMRRELIEPLYEEAMKLQVPERLIAAAALATAATGLVVAPTLMTAGTSLPVEAIGMYVSFAYAAAIGAGATLVAGDTLRTQFYGEIRKEIAKYESVVSSMTGKPVAVEKPTLTRATDTSAADLESARDRARRTAGAQAAHRTM